MEESIENKQLYLRNEIIVNGYDPQEFSIFLANLKGEEKVDLEYWSLSEIKEAVEIFKKSKLKKEENDKKEEKEEKPKKKENINNFQTDKNIVKSKKFQFFRKILRNQSSPSKDLVTDTNNLKENDDQNNKINKSRTKLIQDSENLINNNDKNKNNLDSDKISNNNIKVNENKNENLKNLENIIKCQKLDKNELTDRDDLIIIVSSPTKIKKNKFSNSIQYNLETNPLGFKTTRLFDDFEYLYQKLSLINSQVFNPPLLKESNNQILYLNFYLNSLMESSYYRSLPIIYNFLTLSFEDWEKMKLEQYDKIKDTYALNQIKNYIL